MKGKLVTSLGCVMAVLFISCLISAFEYKRVSSYVSDLIGENINNLNVTRQLSATANMYNIAIMTVIGDDSLNDVPDFDARKFISSCDSLSASLSSKKMQPMVDSLKYAFSAYMLTSLELPDVLKNQYEGARDWYFKRLRPRYLCLQKDIDNLSDAIHKDLNDNSLIFDSVFYRSVIPAMVAVGAGILLTLLLLFYLLQYYARPIDKMNKSLSLFRSMGKKYNYSFDGDDQLKELNDGIESVVEENVQLRKRVSDLRSTLGKGK